MCWLSCLCWRWPWLARALRAGRQSKRARPLSSLQKCLDVGNVRRRTAHAPVALSETLKVHNIERRGRRVYLGSKCIRVRDSDSELGTYYPWLLSFEVSLGSRQVRWRAASTHQLPPTRSGSRVIRSRSAASCGRRDPTTLNTTSSEPRDYTENRQKRMPKGDGGWGRNRVHARGGSEARN